MEEPGIRYGLLVSTNALLSFSNWKNWQNSPSKKLSKNTRFSPQLVKNTVFKLKTKKIAKNSFATFAILLAYVCLRRDDESKTLINKMKTRIPLPKKSAGMIALAMKLLEKHLSDGDTSLLDKVGWETLRPAIERAHEMHVAAEAARVQSKVFMEERNRMLKEVKTGVRSCRNVLAGVRIKSMQSMGEWGFNVMESAPARTKKAKDDLSNKNSSENMPS